MMFCMCAPCYMLLCMLCCWHQSFKPALLHKHLLSQSTASHRMFETYSTASVSGCVHCCRRDRLATLLQLLLPVLLVFMGLAACRIEMWGRQQPPLLMSRQRCMQGRPTLLAASSAVMEQQAQRLQQFMDAYPR